MSVTMNNPPGIETHFRCINSLLNYIRAQDAKGLVRRSTSFGAQVSYETHAGMHFEVIALEVDNIAAQYGYCVDKEIRPQILDIRAWDLPWNSHIPLSKDAYVLVTLRPYEIVDS